MKVLLAVDGSPCSDAAVEAVGRRPWPEGSEIKILSAYELPVPLSPEGWALSPNHFLELDQAVRKQAENIVEGALAHLRPMVDAKVSLQTEVLTGSPGAVIVAESEHWGADLIIVGSHGYGRWERFLLGSVSQSVVSHAKCSVEVIRLRQAA